MARGVRRGFRPGRDLLLRAAGDGADVRRTLPLVEGLPANVGIHLHCSILAKYRVDVGF